MADLSTVIESLLADGSLAYVRTNPLAQFGPRSRPYLGPTILPERLVPANSFEEMDIQYRTVIANDGERYSPAQIKASGQIVGSMEVVLGNQDIALEMTPADYDAVVKYLRTLTGANPTFEDAANRIIQLANSAVAGILMLNEKQRWAAIENASVVRVGNNGFTETVSYPNPAGHRAAAGGTWSSDAYDPMTDILAMQELFAGKGLTVRRMIASTAVARILTNNAKMQARFAPVRVLSSGSDYFSALTNDGINAGFGAMGLPPLETYDAVWRDQTSTGKMLSTTKFVMIADTDREEIIEDGDTYIPLDNVAGYYAVGTPGGQPAPGRALELDMGKGKGATIRVESWQTGLPILSSPESFAVIHTIG